MQLFLRIIIALCKDLVYTVSFPQKNLSWHFMGHKIVYSLSKLCTTDFHHIKYLHLEIGFLFSILKSFYLRISEKMSCKEFAIFFTNLAHISHFRQNHLTLPLPLPSTKIGKLCQVFLKYQCLLFFIIAQFNSKKFVMKYLIT